jgi:hypothetical protein
MMLGTVGCRKSFSLQAFQSLLSRRARQLSKYLSRRRSNQFFLPRQCQLCITDMNIECIHDIPPFDALESMCDDDYRSVLAASDCSDDDLRDDEGLITITWEDVCSVSNFPEVPPFSAPARNERGSVSSTSSSSLSLGADSLQSEWTPLSSPASLAYAECVSQGHSDSLKRKVREDDVDHTIEETLKWILEYI